MEAGRVTRAEGGMSIEDLLVAMRAAEERLEVDPMAIYLFSDGSGHVMAPVDCSSDESVFEFGSVEQLVIWLREGVLLEDEASYA